MQPHRWQPTRLPRPWDSPGKNTTVGCHFLVQCMKVKSESQVAQSCPTLSDPMDYSLPGFSVHGIFQARVLEWGATAFSNSFLLSPTYSTLIPTLVPRIIFQLPLHLNSTPPLMPNSRPLFSRNPSLTTLNPPFSKLLLSG